MFHRIVSFVMLLPLGKASFNHAATVSTNQTAVTWYALAVVFWLVAIYCIFGKLGQHSPTALAAVAIAIGLACLPEDAKKSLLEGLESFWDSILSIGGKTNKPDPAIATKNKQNLKNTKNPEPPKQQDPKKNPPTDVKPTKEQQTKREGLLMGLARAFAEALHGFFGGP